MDPSETRRARRSLSQQAVIYIERGAQRGQATVLVLGLAVVCFAIAGLAVDGTRVFLARRALQNAADGAATAGAGELDTSTYYRTGGRRVLLDGSSARAVAARWLSQRGLDARASITADSRGVNVALHDDVPTSWLSLVGITQIPVSVVARSRPIAGTP
jgi:Putative Flp pilus-assembly TadE/G-like